MLEQARQPCFFDPPLGRRVGQGGCDGVVCGGVVVPLTFHDESMFGDVSGGERVCAGVGDDARVGVRSVVPAPK